jgi:hypothetical protein
MKLVRSWEIFLSSPVGPNYSFGAILLSAIACLIFYQFLCIFILFKKELLALDLFITFVYGKVITVAHCI